MSTHRRRLRFKKVTVFLSLGLAASVVVALLASLPALPGWTGTTARGQAGNQPWTATRWNTPTRTITHTGPPALERWSHLQATGPPDTPTAGDLPTAWASATPDGQVEWLTLQYDTPVRPAVIEVHETYNPGALVKISTTMDGRELILWEGTDPTQPGAGWGVSTIRVQTEHTLDTITLTLDSPAVRGWNEIDAVALVEADGTRLWAVNTTASSTYGSTTPAQALKSPEDILPRWHPPPRQLTDVPHHSTVASGWPARCLYTDVAVSPGPNRLIGGITLPAGLAHPIPYKPLWIGLLLNMLFWGVLVYLFVWAVRPLARCNPVPAVREAMRARRGCCPGCNFDLQFDLARGCPECGWRR